MAATVFFESTSEIATLSNTFKVNGTPTDPTSVTLTVTSPSNVVTTYTWPAGPNTLTHGGTGQFSQDVTCAEDGEWQYLWEGTTAASDAEAGSWTVFETVLGKLYTPIQALKSKLKIAASDTQDDYELHTACFSASRSIEQVCERTFYRTTSAARTFQPCNLYWLKFGPWNDLVSLTTLKTDAGGDGVYETTWAASDYKLYPLNPLAAPEQKPYTMFKAVGSQTLPVVTGIGRDDLVEITGVWGWPAVPWAVRQASLMLAEEIQKSTPYGVAGFGDLGIVRVRENPRIMKLIGPYIHPMAALKVA